MGFRSGVVSGEGGRRVVILLGGLYATAATVRGLVHLLGDTPLLTVLTTCLLVGVPGVVLAYSGYRMPRADVSSMLYQDVAGWCLAGLVVMLGVVVVYQYDHRGGVDHLIQTGLVFTSFGSLGGFAVGLHDAKAKSRALAAERYSRELERQNERLESFAGMLAHELRNPIQVAQIYHSQARPRNEDAAEEVATALDSIEELLDVLLVTVRGRDADIDREPVPVADAAGDAWAEVSTEAAAAELVAETDRTVSANPVHLRHLLANLFRNSVEHSDGPVTVRICDFDDEDGFYVEDDGPGIPEDVREEVVEAGYTSKADGIGLGLTFVAQLVEAYGWDWTISDGAADGARFEFTDLDLAPPERKLPQN